MTRIETAKRYMSVLNESITLTSGDTPCNIGNLIKKYGVSSALLTYCLAQGMYKRVGRGTYICTMTDYITEEKTEELVKGFNVWKAAKRNGTEHPVIQNIPSPLAGFTTALFIDELKRRGYSGKLEIKKELVF